MAVRRRVTPRMRPPVVQQCMGRVGICPRRICRLSRSPPRPWARFYTILVYGPPRLSAGRSVCCPACSRVMPYHANPSPVPTASPPRRGSHARRLSLPVRVAGALAAAPSTGAGRGARRLSESLGLSPRRHRPAPGGARGGCLGRAAPAPGAGGRGARRLSESLGFSSRRHRPVPGGARGGPAAMRVAGAHDSHGRTFHFCKH